MHYFNPKDDDDEDCDTSKKDNDTSKIIILCNYCDSQNIFRIIVLWVHSSQQGHIIPLKINCIVQFNYQETANNVIWILKIKVQFHQWLNKLFTVCLLSIYFRKSCGIISTSFLEAGRGRGDFISDFAGMVMNHITTSWIRMSIYRFAGG